MCRGVLPDAVGRGASGADVAGVAADTDSQAARKAGKCRSCLTWTRRLLQGPPKPGAEAFWHPENRPFRACVLLVVAIAAAGSYYAHALVRVSRLLGLRGGSGRRSVAAASVWC